MRYLGGKSRIAKPLAAYLSQVREGRPYLEPFLGAGHVLFEMTGERIGSDANLALINMWKAVQDGWMPPETISEEDYQALKDCCPCALQAYAAFQGSFGGKWFAGYARDPKSDRNFIKNGHRSIRYAKARMDGVRLTSQDYHVWSRVEGMLVYCDPPYENTTSYGAVAAFDHTEFWEWAVRLSTRNTVLVSSYQAPPTFKSVWQLETHTDLQTKSGGKAPRTEHLFQYQPE